MSAASSCDCACPTPEITNIPGVEGDGGLPGAAGAAGVGPFTLLTADAAFANTVATVIAEVALNTGFAVGQTVFMADPSGGTDHGTFEVMSKSGTTFLGLRFMAAPGDTPIGAGLTIGTGGIVTATGATGALSGALPTAVDYSALTTAGAVDNLVVAGGAGKYKLVIPCTPVAGVGAGEVVKDYLIGHKFRITDWSFVAAVAIVGGSRVFNMEIDGTDVGTAPSTITLPATAIGDVVNGVSTPVVGANSGSNIQAFSIEVAAGGTSITAGSGFFIVTVQNMETADAIASLSDHTNDLIAAL